MTKVTAQLVIMRHGETTYNADNRITGLHDADLTPKGEKQGDDAGPLISTFHFDKVYSSHLKRAFNTAARALTASGTQMHLQNPDGSWQIEQRRELAEIDWGIYSGLRRDDPILIARNKGYDVVPEGGESQKQAHERVRAFFEAEIQPRLERGENVLIVAHAGVLRLFNAILGVVAQPEPGKPFLQGKVENGRPTHYSFEDGVLVSATQLHKAANENHQPPAQKKKHGGPKN